MGKESLRKKPEEKENGLMESYAEFLKEYQGYTVIKVVRKNPNKKFRVTHTSKVEGSIVPAVGKVKLSKGTCMKCIRKTRKWNNNDRQLWKDFGIINCPTCGGVYIDEEDPPKGCVYELEHFMDDV